jgi:hypothetical protein
LIYQGNIVKCCGLADFYIITEKDVNQRILLSSIIRYNICELSACDGNATVLASRIHYLQLVHPNINELASVNHDRIIIGIFKVVYESKAEIASILCYNIPKSHVL